jgi:CBS domain-containing protein
MQKPPRLKSVMTPFPYAVQIDAPLSRARSMMLEHSVHHLPVKAGRGLQGIISDRDIKLLIGPQFDASDTLPAKPGTDPNLAERLTVRDGYVRDSLVIDINTTLHEVLAMMAGRRLGAALVTRNDQLAGIFTVTDACRVFAEFLAPDTTPDKSA